jgi:hypothetical protein
MAASGNTHCPYPLAVRLPLYTDTLEEHLIKKNQIMISKDSIFYKIPSNLDQKQIFLIEGIRYCYNSICISYSTLIEKLDQISDRQIDDFSFPIVFKEAWSQIDTTNRLLGFLKAIYHQDSNFTKHEDYIFLSQTRPFRNTFQHLDERIDGILLKLNAPVWGNISWLKIIDEKNLLSCLLCAGHPRKDFNSRGINPMGLVVRPPIDKITIEAVQSNINEPVIRIELSELFNRTKTIISKLEMSLEKKILPHISNGILPQDILIALIIETNNEA